jgi:hypothetical protein
MGEEVLAIPPQEGDWARRPARFLGLLWFPGWKSPLRCGKSLLYRLGRKRWAKTLANHSAEKRRGATLHEAEGILKRGN